MPAGPPPTMQHRVVIVRWGGCFEAASASMIWLRLKGCSALETFALRSAAVAINPFYRDRSGEDMTSDGRQTSRPLNVRNHGRAFGKTVPRVQPCGSVRRLHFRISGKAKFSTSDHSARRELTKLSAIASSDVPINSIADSCR